MGWNEITDQGVQYLADTLQKNTVKENLWI
jgi:hypothetical protein